LTGVSDEQVHPHLYHNQRQQQQQQSACYPLNNRLLCLQCHLRRLTPSTTTTVTTTVGCSSSSNSSSSCTADTCWNGFDVPWPPVGVAYNSAQNSLFVDVTLDGDASSSCTTSDDVTVSDDVISNPGSDVTAEFPQQAASEHAQSVDSGHCSGTGDETATSSDTETLEDEEEEEEDTGDDDGGDGDKDDNLSPVTSDTLVRDVMSYDNLSILDLLADSSRVTDL